MRKYEEKTNRVLTALLACWALFQLFFSVLGTMDAVTFRGWHGLFLLAFAFVFFSGKGTKGETLRFPPWFDLLLVAGVLATYGYFAARYVTVAMSGGMLGALYQKTARWIISSRASALRFCWKPRGGRLRG